MSLRWHKSRGHFCDRLRMWTRLHFGSFYPDCLTSGISARRAFGGFSELVRGLWIARRRWQRFFVLFFFVPEAGQGGAAARKSTHGVQVGTGDGYWKTRPIMHGDGLSAVELGGAGSGRETRTIGPASPLCAQSIHVDPRCFLLRFRRPRSIRWTTRPRLPANSDDSSTLHHSSLPPAIKPWVSLAKNMPSRVDKDHGPCRHVLANAEAT
ncbi:hypothetical protein LZ31DRAFT_339555 [Colletotrichum somersetense]|nr:hypothetical protein LZ31DRAFT_339555 [Colletotrichum somersetense]